MVTPLVILVTPLSVAHQAPDHGISQKKTVSELIRSDFNGLGHCTKDKMIPNNSLGSRMDPRG